MNTGGRGTDTRGRTASGANGAAATVIRVRGDEEVVGAGPHERACRAGSRTREDWPGGAKTLTARLYPGTERDLLVRCRARPRRRPCLVRVAEEAIDRMPEKTLRAGGARLVDALIVWITPERQLKPRPQRLRGPGLRSGATRGSNVCDGEMDSLARLVPPPRRSRRRVPAASPEASLGSRARRARKHAAASAVEALAGALPRP